MMAARKASRAVGGVRDQRNGDQEARDDRRATATPIICGSSPLAFSQTGKNGNWMPLMMNSAGIERRQARHETVLHGA